jgi:hypothetical protein
MARTRRWYAIAGGLGLALAGCGGGPTGPPPGPPSIVLAASSVTFAGVQGSASPGPQTVAIKAGTNGVALSGIAVGSITYTGASGWLTASVDQTRSPATLTIGATTGGLAAGSYTAGVPITATGATNSPQQVAVTLLVLNGSGGTTLATAGQSAVFLNAPSTATQLTVQAGSQYLIAVVNTGAAYTATEDFTLAGAFLGAPVARMVPLPAAGAPPAGFAAAQGPAYAVSGTDRAALAAASRLVQNHLAMLDRNRRVFARLGNPQAVRARLGITARTARISAAVTTTIGNVNKVYVAKGLGGGCIDVDSIGARTVAVGQHIIVLADTNLTTWPQAQRPDSGFYQTFADEYDLITWPHTQTYVGDPLAYDASLSSLDKVTLTITPVLNGVGGGIVAFVNGCDFFPFASSGTDADFSNVTEMFYSLTPSANGYSVSAWKKELRATAAHETKHIVSYADRIINNSPVLEEIWLEEGLAQQSAEIWERNFNQATWKGNATFGQTVACEISLGTPCDAANDKPFALVISHLPFFFEYLQNESQNAEGLGKDTPANYGAGWAIARWATDQYASPDEGTFIKALVNEPALSGLANLSSHTGQSIPELLMYWNLASAIYTTPTYTAADPRITIPSFNFAEIFNVGQTQLTCSGQPCGLFTNSGTPVYPLQPRAFTAGTINQTVTGVPGTAAAYFLLTAPSAGTEALQLESGSGGTLSPSSALRLGIIRVH